MHYKVLNSTIKYTIYYNDFAITLMVKIFELKVFKYDLNGLKEHKKLNKDIRKCKYEKVRLR